MYIVIYDHYIYVDVLFYLGIPGICNSFTACSANPWYCKTATNKVINLNQNLFSLMIESYYWHLKAKFTNRRGFIYL